MDQASDEFVHALYGAVLEPRQWGDALTRLAALADAPHASLMDIDFAAGLVHREVLIGINEVERLRYLQKYASLDPRVPMALGSHKLAWHSDYDFFDDEFRKKDRFYVEYMQPNHAGESLLTTFAREGSRIGTSALIRESHQGRVAQANRQRLDSIFPHMDRALKLSRRFAAITSEAILGHNVLNALDEPLACVTSDGRVHRANTAFENVLRAGNLLSTEARVLRTGDPTVHAQFMRAIRECCRIAEGGSSKDPDAHFTIRIDQAAGAPVFVTIAPLSAYNLKSWAGRPCALIRLDEPLSAPSDEKLVEVLGLTAAEARLVSALCSGGTLISAAERIGISINTAKTQIAAAFSKTGVSRQSELIALVAVLPRKH